MDSKRYFMFQYRKRYEVTCDLKEKIVPVNLVEFQYRKRYEVTCDGRFPVY